MHADIRGNIQNEMIHILAGGDYSRVEGEYVLVKGLSRSGLEGVSRKVPRVESRDSH